ncbi:Re/Si-specific NAD(P)(+) transhydrogenase subunit alpha [Pseudomonadota bacterium]|uniref:Re/Si-specific NAD(P)(+) transhydrogenase subunit alpha n=1 Tax=unclassified Shewanella TaxID=196818 RepID=UPI000C823FF1|nr:MULTISPECIES: Re/Si-specific NAD(P)(+) transhydrogenase subunit alpha [unclassified Shewanella]MDO6617929.1 Re/Si-specific NAD(P)(+) transhydrogenase subunit alpha [Shewanella sp. 6_MG-2023]MDO6639945.1 Re/Si-specific NAD(P)(+) transhydrogenase subunit alpha [Shewanella sp. 5_MG-2023]MDO6678293.1 Re/Si-specific NAD(P)(+) transhydrogenase subunit alpha [Shewanella sp. 4_MG-2023]PMG28138.1 NAD(P) transhydrogenase subunit alpha [Shewanella sp. 10N.286.52.C2]PMH86953.1 NAD(P) transhydrogenase s
MKLGLPKESHPGELRVALIPANVTALLKKQLQVIVESGAGQNAGFTDDDYVKVGATIASSRAALLNEADIITVVNCKGEQFDEIKALIKPQQLLIGMMDPLINPQNAQAIADTGASAIALELIPRITRAQSMDVLSSMATISGYKAVLLAAHKAPRLFPMMMTAAGTLKPTRAFIMGVGVAGLQACATAKRLGAVVEAYDIRPAAREQIISVGAKPVELDIEAENTETKGGYATEQSDDFLKRQQQAMANVLAQQDIVITTAAIPGRKAPVLITKEMVDGMKNGTIIVDLAAESGGNCELTRVDEVIMHNGVMILGPSNVPSTAANHASQMYGKNVENLLNLIVSKEGELVLDFEDEIVRDTVVAHGKEVTSARLRDLLGLAPLATPEADTSVEEKA